MGRPTKRTQFVKRLLKEIEDGEYPEIRTALYKEYILHLTTNSPRWLYDTIVSTATQYWDYMNSREPKNDIEELITDMGFVLDDIPLIDKLIEGLNSQYAL